MRYPLVLLQMVEYETIASQVTLKLPRKNVGEQMERIDSCLLAIYHTICRVWILWNRSGAK
jgi:hypothetical protein